MNEKRNILVLFLYLACHLSSGAQGNNRIWYFGQNAGLDFSTSPPQAITSPLSTNEGCAIMCDRNGQLLFYSNGESVWDRQHQLMPTGSDLAGGLSATQAALIVPVPGSCDRYYVFTVEDHYENGDFFYSEVDMSLRNGMGDVVLSNKNTLITTHVAEKSIAIPHHNGTDCWILTHKTGSDQFLAFLMTSDGLNPTPVISAVGSTYNSLAVIGPVKASPDGKKIVSSASFHNICDLFDFDASTGRVSNPVNLNNTLGSPNYVYGIEFSPDNKLLYLTSFWVTSYLYQIELSTMDVTILHSIPGNYEFGALQSGPDGKIYHARSQKNFLDVIHFPDLKGSACSYEEMGKPLLPGTGSGLGLPNVTPLSLFSTQQPQISLGPDIMLCAGDSIIIGTGLSEIPLTVFHWDDASTDSLRTIYSPGAYWVEAGNSCGTSRDTIEITSAALPYIDFRDTMFCEGEVITIDVSQDGASYLWSNQSTTPTLTVEEDGIYAVTVTNPCGAVADTFVANTIELPQIDLADTSICAGQQITYDAFHENATYQWSDQSTASTVILQEEGIYSVTVSNSCGIVDDAFSISYLYAPSVEIADTVLCDGQEMIIHGPPGDVSYAWSDFTTEPFFHIDAAGTYAVTVTNGCGSDTAQFMVLGIDCSFSIYMPNVFSPNDDGINDVIGPSFSKSVSSYTLSIFDRWGNEVFESTNSNSAWDGMFRGHKAPPGVYAFTLTATPIHGASKELQGNITLIR